MASRHFTATAVDTNTVREAGSTLGQHCEDFKLQHNAKFKKSFNIWSAIGLMATSQATPVALGTFLSLVIGVGGSPVFVYAYFIGSVFDMMICISLAEIASVYPAPAGQIYWVAVLMGKNGRWLSFITGWMVCAGWFLWLGGNNLQITNMIFALVKLYHPGFEATSWQISLMITALAIICILVNIPLFNIYPAMSYAMLFWLPAGTIFISVTLLVKAQPKQSAHAVFVEITNKTGWDSTLLVFCIGLVPALGILNSFDCVTHMADEVSDPERIVPLVMIGSSFVSFIAGIPMLFAYMFCITRPENLATPIGGVPLVQLFADAYDSKALTVASTTIIAGGMLAANIAILCAGSRAWWSFAELKGTPFPKYFSQISDDWALPVNSIMFLGILSTIVTLVVRGSTTALNAIIGGGLLCVFLSYMIPMLCLLIHSRKNLPKDRYLNLGGAGLVLNVLGSAWVIFMTFWMCFPLYYPVTAVNMNYTVAILTALFLIATVTWHSWSKDQYMVPSATMFDAADVPCPGVERFAGPEEESYGNASRQLSALHSSEEEPLLARSQ